MGVQNLDKETAERAVTIMTTEHFTLHTARSATIADANGRAGLFVSRSPARWSRWPSSGRSRDWGPPSTSSG